MRRQPRTVSETISLVEGLTPTQNQVLQALARSAEPLRVDDLSQSLELHGNTIRGVLAALLEAGLVTRTAEETERRGRPSWLYEARASADAQLVVEGFGSLMAVLADQLESAAPAREQAAESARALGAQWGSQILSDQPEERRAASGKPEDVPHHVANLRVLLTRLGFQATAGDHDNTLELHQCPLVDANSEQNPHLICQMHQGMLNQIVQETSDGTLGAQVTPFAGPGYCRVHIERHRE